MIRDNVSACTDVLALALAAAEAGRAVIPLCRKYPLKNSHGYKDATREPSLIRGMFAAAPHADGYGIATGQASGVVVVDVDGTEARAEAERRGLHSGYVCQKRALVRRAVR